MLRDRRVRNHPDREEAGRWVQDEVDRLRALGYPQLLHLRDAPRHHPFTSRTGRQLVGETCVYWAGVDEGPLRVRVVVWERRRWRIARSIASDDFIRAYDGRFVGK